MDQDPERVSEALLDLVVEFGLHRAQAMTDTHTITITEPGLWDDETELQTTIEEKDI